MALLEVRDVGKTFGGLKALEGVSVDVQANSFHGLIGPNGSGKSTLLKAIAGAHFASTGTITFDGADITRAEPYERARAGLSLKFQITAVLPALSVYDNVLIVLQTRNSIWQLIRSRSRGEMHDRVMEALQRFRLADHADVLAGELSHGQQQWLEIAMALAPQPKLLLLDEPTGGMSPEERRGHRRAAAADPEVVRAGDRRARPGFHQGHLRPPDRAAAGPGAGERHGCGDRALREGAGGLYHPCLTQAPLPTCRRPSWTCRPSPPAMAAARCCSMSR